MSETKLDENINKIMKTDAEYNTAVYMKEKTTASQIINLSQIKNAEEAIRMLNTVKKSAVEDYYYGMVGEEPAPFVTTTKDEYITHVNLAEDGIYYRKSDISGDVNDLIFLPKSADGLGVAKRIDDNVASLFATSFDGKQLYTRHDGKGKYSLKTASGTRTDRLSQDVPPTIEPYREGETLVYYTEYDSERGSGELMMNNNKDFIIGSDKKESIGKDVQSYSYRTDDMIYTYGQMNHKQKLGKLYVYTNHKQVLVDEYVTQILK